MQHEKRNIVCHLRSVGLRKRHRAESGVLRALLLVICVLILLLIGSMLGKNSYVHQHQDNRNLTDDNEIDVEEVSDKKGNEDK